MKKLSVVIVSLIFILSAIGCSSNDDTKITNTFVPTESNLIEEYMENSKEVISTEYYELSDGTWKSGEYIYKYKLLITGRLNNAKKDITYTILSNIEDITFEQASKASGLSSNSNDYFEKKDVVFVATKME